MSIRNIMAVILGICLSLKFTDPRLSRVTTFERRKKEERKVCLTHSGLQSEVSPYHAGTQGAP